MSLTKLFNFNFMKQMLKKSKGQIVLFLGLVPVFTFFILMSTYPGDSVDVVRLETISLFNFIGMYFIPIILSINLFSYIYSRSSVDFINSMPISKKTIFLSNSILGIVLIILMQLLNVLGIFIFTILKPEITIIFDMVWDAFIISTISYIFVFSVTNLAMCLSGNHVTQIVLTCIIAFIIPFTVSNFNESFFSLKTGNYEINMNEDSKEIVENSFEGIIDLVKVNEYHETMPYRLLKIAFEYDDGFYFDWVSNVKMVVLSIIYVALGGMLFKNRKFENLGDSFKSVKVHEFVKALTMFPMFAILNKVDVLEMNIEFILFVYAALIVYFFIYDIITNKKQSLKVSIIYIIIIFVSLNIITLGIEKILEKQEPKTYTINDVKSVSVNLDGMKEYDTEILDYEITDKNIIREVLKTAFAYVSTIKVNMTDGNELYVNKYYVTADQDYAPWDDLIDLLKTDAGYVEKLKEVKIKEGIYTFENEVLIKGELLEKVEKYVTEFQKNNINIEDYNNIKSDAFVVEKYIYDNHKLSTERYEIKDEELLKEIVKEVNNYFINKTENIKPDEFSAFTIKNYIEGYNVYYYDEANRLLDLIRNDNTEIDFSKEYITICKYDTNTNLYYVTCNEELVKLYYEELDKMDPGENEVKYYYNNQDVMVEIKENTEVVENTISKD